MGLLCWNYLFYISWQIIYILKKKSRGKTEEQNPNPYQCSVHFVLLHLCSFIPHRRAGSLSYLDLQNNLPPYHFQFLLADLFYLQCPLGVNQQSQWKRDLHSHDSFRASSCRALAFFTFSWWAWKLLEMVFSYSVSLHQAENTTISEQTLIMKVISECYSENCWNHVEM